MKTLLFTFDYELFLGNKSGGVLDCLIRPTDILLDIFLPYKYKLVFFVDTTYLITLKSIIGKSKEAEKDMIAIRNQLTKIAQAGHYIFPHLHPHWLDAKYIPETNEWNLGNHSRYRFSTLPDNVRSTLFKESIDILKEILGSSLTQPIDAYRAGGWSLQPFSDFKPLFEHHGIYHDWSVMPGKFQMSDAHVFDFRNVTCQSPYTFDNDVTEEVAHGKFVEWPISAISMGKASRWIDFKLNGILQRIKGKSSYVGSTVNSIVVADGDSLTHLGKYRITASFEGLNHLRVLKYIKLIRSSSYFHFISHPKMLTINDFKFIKILLIKISKVKNIQSDFSLSELNKFNLCNKITTNE